ncbi:hypothetical protein RHSIM_Rhsim12G0031300 [Rhododendron simsii]|uniref:Beta-amylase n=1 Tax=Rhododendron simsii TaxID=118357 RepID=A0A834G468_RHOSS|nr:hypothetical protein RHSIM_Rhsim12G0031300 [Rhododendron simsii]
MLKGEDLRLLYDSEVDTTTVVVANHSSQGQESNSGGSQLPSVTPQPSLSQQQSVPSGQPQYWSQPSFASPQFSEQPQSSISHAEDKSSKVQESDLSGTAYVHVNVMLPLDVINIDCELVDPDELRKKLQKLKSANVDGVMVDCWWGIIERHAPQQYNWSGYRSLFQIVRDLDLKLQVVMSFHECGGNVGDDVQIPLPQWVAEIGEGNPDIFFRDRERRHNPECLTWGVDEERVLSGRTALEVYFEFMRSFRVEFDEFFKGGIISEIEIGLGPCGELRYPSYPEKLGWDWEYPRIGEFQCYDRYLSKSLKTAAEEGGHPSTWESGPENAGSYNSRPDETEYFRDGGEYDSDYGRFFLNWYSQVLVDHGDRLPGIHWLYQTASHAAELTAGFYNTSNHDGYTRIATMLMEHGAALNFTCVELRTRVQNEESPEALADPEALVRQVFNAAWDVTIRVACENALPCYNRESYDKILENAKLPNNPEERRISAFTYLRLSSVLMLEQNFTEFEQFVKRMHGEALSGPE